MIATKESATTVSPPVVSVRGIEGGRILGWLGTGFPLAVSAALNLWNIAQNGYSNLYYSVAVQSMIQSWHNFFFASYDAGGFITVDKPPVALWVQAISARLFGFSSFSLLVPQALLGVATVALVGYLVRRAFGPFAGLIAATAMALTPIAVAMERTNGVDTMLMFTLLLAAWAISLAAEKGRLALLALSLAFVGVAFNVKMLAAFIVLPAFYLLYLVSAPVAWRKRLLHLGVGSVVLLAVSLSWPLAVQLTPADQRPWVGGSDANSVFDLALNYNGLGRVTGEEQGGPGGPRGGFGGMQPPGGRQRPFGDGRRLPPGAQGNLPVPGANPFPGAPGSPPVNPFPGNAGGPVGGPGGPGGPGGAGGMFGAGQPGAFRLFTGLMAGQWSWLFPLVAFGLPAALWGMRRRLLPLDRRGQSLLLWGGWLGMYGVVFSMASGIFHPYYLILLGPAVAALVGVGLAALWAAYRSGLNTGSPFRGSEHNRQSWLLPAALAATALWQVNVLSGYPQWSAWLTPLLLGGSLIAAGGLVAARSIARSGSNRVWMRRSSGLLGTAVVALLLAPMAWSATPVLAGPSNASLPVAGPEALNQNDPGSWTQLRNAENSGLVSYLQANQEGYFYLVAVSNSQQASSIALATGRPVLATGGFMGGDPALTAEKLAEMVAAGRVRFVTGIGEGAGPGMGPGMRGAGNAAVNQWVQSNCTPVDPSLYGGQTGSTGQVGGRFGLGNAPLYNCAARQ